MYILSVIEQVQLEQLTKELGSLTDDLKERFPITESMLTSNTEASDDSSGSWCEGIAEAKAGSRGGARSTYRLVSFEREGALSLVASSSARARD